MKRGMAPCGHTEFHAINDDGAVDSSADSDGIRLIDSYGGRRQYIKAYLSAPWHFTLDTRIVPGLACHADFADGIYSC